MRSSRRSHRRHDAGFGRREVMTDVSGDAQGFPHDWRVEVLKMPPLIAPARQFTYPRQIAGEEDALARGALQLMVRPASGGTFLATCALGFTDPAMPTGVFSCPNSQEMCAVAGGYAYVIDTTQPELCTHLGVEACGRGAAAYSSGVAAVRRLPFDDGMGNRRPRVAVGAAELGRNPHRRYWNRNAAWHWLGPDVRSRRRLLTRSSYRAAFGWRL